MNLSDRELLKKLTEAVSLLVPSTFGEGAQLAAIPPVALHRRYSFMFRFWVQLPDGTMQPILAKIPHDSWMKTLQEAIESDHIRDVIRSEFETMSAIASAITDSANPMLSSIHPRAVLLEFNALLMDELPIRMLKTALSRISIMLGMGKDWQDFETYLLLSGEWLRVIHGKFAADQQMSLSDLGLREKVEGQLKFLEHCSGLSLKQLRDPSMHLHDSIKGVCAPFSSLHNDYHPGNIFVTEDHKLGVLDPNWVESGSIYVDLASLLIYPATGKIQVLTQGLQFRSSLRRRYEQTVLRGYCRDFEISYPVLYFYCAAAVLQKWRDNEELLMSKKNMLYRLGSWFLAPWIRFYFRRLVKSYLVRGIKA